MGRGPPARDAGRVTRYARGMSAWLIALAGAAGGAWLLARDPRRRPRGSAFLGFLVLAIGLTAPLVRWPGRLTLDAGAGPDAFIGVWNLWWTGTALAQGSNPFFCDRLFSPVGTSLALHTHSVTYGVLTWPLQRVMGEEGLFAAFNVAVLGSFTLAGWLGFRLAHTLTGNREASVLAGALCAYSSFRFANTVRLHVLATEWLILFVWALVVFLRRPVPRGLPALAGAGLLLLYASLESTVHAALLGTILLAAAVERYRREGVAVEGGAGRWLVATTLAAVLAAGALPFGRQLRARLAEGAPAFDPGLAGHFSADLLDFFVPNPRHPLWGAATAPWTARLHAGDGGYGLSLGVVALVAWAAAGATALRARHGRIWLAAGLLCAAVALGPDLRIGATVHSLPMPHDALTALVPLLAGSRTPIRWISPAVLCLAMVLALAWSHWRPGGRERMSGPGIAALALLLFESLAVPLRMTEVPIPAVYREIAATPPRARDAVVHVPELPPREKLLYQTVHGRPLAGNVIGAIPHRSPAADASLRDPAWSWLLRDFGRSGGVPALPPEERARVVRGVRALLGRAGVRWIVVSPAAWVHEARGASRHVVLGPEAREGFLASLRELDPVRERTIGEETLFELATSSTETDSP